MSVQAYLMSDLKEIPYRVHFFACSRLPKRQMRKADWSKFVSKNNCSLTFTYSSYFIRCTLFSIICMMLLSFSCSLYSFMCALQLSRHDCLLCRQPPQTTSHENAHIDSLPSSSIRFSRKQLCTQHDQTTLVVVLIMIIVIVFTRQQSDLERMTAWQLTTCSLPSLLVLQINTGNNKTPERIKKVGA